MSSEFVNVNNMNKWAKCFRETRTKRQNTREKKNVEEANHFGPYHQSKDDGKNHEKHYLAAVKNSEKNVVSTFFCWFPRHIQIRQFLLLLLLSSNYIAILFIQYLNEISEIKGEEDIHSIQCTTHANEKRWG